MECPHVHTYWQGSVEVDDQQKGPWLDIHTAEYKNNI
jgi:hypothetical protein